MRFVWKRIRYHLEWAGMLIVAKVVPMLSRNACYRLALAVGGLMSMLDRHGRKVALSNLLSNAIKYQKRHPDHKPEIKVSSLLINNQVQISIADNGEGISDAYKDKIFEMFYRGRSNSSGSGLGLYIAKEAVEKLHGSISVETTYGKGSNFTLQLPVMTSVDSINDSSISSFRNKYS